MTKLIAAFDKVKGRQPTNIRSTNYMSTIRRSSVLKNYSVKDRNSHPDAFWIISQLHRKIPAPKCLFFKAAGLPKNRLCHRCFPVNFTKLLRHAFLSLPTDEWF